MIMAFFQQEYIPFILQLVIPKYFVQSTLSRQSQKTLALALSTSSAQFEIGCIYDPSKPHFIHSQFQF